VLQRGCRDHRSGWDAVARPGRSKAVLESVWFEAMPDNEISVTNEYVAGSVVVQEAVFSGTHTGNLAAPNGLVVPPTGRHVQAPYVDILVVEGDQIASDHLYWDQVELLTQLGLMPAEPLAAEG